MDSGVEQTCWKNAAASELAWLDSGVTPAPATTLMQAALAAAGTGQATTTCPLKQTWARGLCVPLSSSVSAACAPHAPQGSAAAGA